MVLTMEVLAARSSTVSAVSFRSWPHRTVLTRTTAKINFISKVTGSTGVNASKASNKVENKLSWNLDWVGSATMMTSVMFGTVSRALAVAADEIRDPTGRFDMGGGVNDVAAFLDKNPFFVFGASFVVFFVIPVISDQADKSRKWITAESAYSKIRDEVESQLVDIRSIDDIKVEGSPNISGFNKKVVEIPYTEDDDAFLIDMFKAVRNPSNATLYILDKYDGKSMQVAQMLTRYGFKAAYAIRDGYQGSNGWQATEEKLFANTTSRLVNRESLPIQITESRTITCSTGPEVGTSPVSQRATVEPASQQKVDLSILAKENVSEVESIDVASEEPGLPGSLSPYPKYPDLKPPASPTPPKPITTKDVAASASNGAAISDQKVDVSEIETSSFSQPLSPYSGEQSIEGAHCSSSPSSPYAKYPDLKPPTSPTPSKPTIKMIDAAMSNGPVISDQHSDVHASTIKSATVPSSIRENGSNEASQPEVVEPVEASDFSRPLSPYPSYPDLKPPTSPTPSRP